MSIKFEASGDFSQLLAENQKYQAQLVKLTQQVERLEKAGVAAHDKHAASARKAGEATKDGSAKVDAHRGSLGSLNSQVASLAAGYISWQGALQLAGEALQFVQQETEKAKGSQDSLVDSRRRLVQISESAEDLDAMVERADAAAEKYGVSRNVAQSVLFSARSEGWENDYESVMKSAPVMAPESAAVVAGQVPGLFKQSEQLTSEQAISGTLLAAQQSRLNFEEIAKAMPQAAEGAAIAKASFSETAATLSVLAARFKSGDTAADRIKGFATKLGLSAEFGGKGLVAGFEALQAADEATRKDFLGSSNELNAVYQILGEELPTVKERVVAINQEVQSTGAGAPSLVDRQTEIALSDQASQAQLRRKQAEIGREIANEEQFAVSGSNRQAARDETMSDLKRAGVVGVAQYAGQKAGDIVDLVGGSDRAAATATRAGAAAVGGTGPMDFLWRRLLGAATLGGSDLLAAGQAAMAAPDDRIQRDQLDAIKKQTEVLERVANRLGQAPRSGASAAAAAPNVQRQGR